MEQNIKEVFDKVSMDEDKMGEIRNRLDKKRQFPMWTKAVACVAIGIAVLFAIPSTRAMMAYAADRIIHIFHTADGGQVIYEETDSSLEFTVNYTEDSYVEIADGRIYMTVDDKKIDVTNDCDKESYYRYEIAHDDGSKSVIFVGGSLEKAGYVELLFDKDGKYVFNKMNVPVCEDGNTEPWADNAMHAEGVPTGNIELDK